jgi:tRNA 2-thiouridine synthesizing protein A
MERGQILRVISTDQGSLKDFEAFSKQTNNPLLSSGEEGGKFVFLLKKS